MNPVNLAQLVILAALWGASFLFIRVGVADFGVAPLMALGVAIRAMFLVALLSVRQPISDTVATVKRHAWPLLVVGIINSAAPFCLFAYAELTLSAGVTSVMIASTPLWGAVVAFVWLSDRLSASRNVGLAIGFAGVILLVWQQVAAPTSGTPHAVMLAVVAGLTAAASYGVAASYTKRYLAGSRRHARPCAPRDCVLALDANLPSRVGSRLCLGVGCTGIAFLMFYHLVSTIGAARAITVTFLIPDAWHPVGSAIPR